MESIWSILDLTEINFWHSFDTYAKVTHASITTFDFSLFDDYLINVNKQHLRQAYMQFNLPNLNRQDSMQSRISYTLSREYRVVRNRYSRLLFTDEDRLCANLREQEYDVTMPIPHVCMTSQINWRHNAKSEEIVLSYNGEIVFSFSSLNCVFITWNIV